MLENMNHKTPNTDTFKVVLMLKSKMINSLSKLPIRYLKRRLVKVGLSPSKKICVICLIENPLNHEKSFLKKALSFLELLSFCHNFLIMLEKRID